MISKLVTVVSGGLDVHVEMPVVPDAVERRFVYSRNTVLLRRLCRYTLLSRTSQGENFT